MLHRTLGRTGLRVSLAGLGTGGPSQMGQSAGLTPAESHRLVRTALDLGINVFDTSPGYARSEELLGQALKGIPRDQYVLATKFQPKQGGAIKPDPKALTEQLEESLRRLGVDTIDVLQYHGVTADIYQAVVERFHSTALSAKDQGKVRFIGVTESVRDDPRHEMLPMALKGNLFDTIMVRYGILNQLAAEKVLAVAQVHNVGVFVMAPVRTTLRTPSEAAAAINHFIDEGALSIPRPHPDDPLGLGTLGEPVPAITRAAYQFAAAHGAVSTVLIGTGNAEHLRANVADLLRGTLSEAQLTYLRQTYGGLAWNA